MTAAGDLIEVQTDTGRWQQGLITGVVSGDTVNCVVWCDGSDWPAASPWNGNGAYLQQLWAASLDKGTSVNQWRPSTSQAAQVAGLLATPTPSAPSRTLDTTFQPSSTRPTLCIYSVRVDDSITLSAGARGRVELRSDAASPPTTVRARHAGGTTGTLVVGANLTDTVEGTLMYLVPAGHNVRLVTVTESGSPSFTLQSSAEIAL